MKKLIELAFGAVLGILCISALCYAADPEPEYWVDYQFNSYVRKTATDAWAPRLSGPFGVRSGWGVGAILTEFTLTDPKLPNCYAIDWKPKNFNGLDSLDTEVTVEQYRGDIYCEPVNSDPRQFVASFTLHVRQHEQTAFELPFPGGQEVRVEMSQVWRLRPDGQ